MIGYLFFGYKGTYGVVIQVEIFPSHLLDIFHGNAVKHFLIFKNIRIIILMIIVFRVDSPYPEAILLLIGFAIIKQLQSRFF